MADVLFFVVAFGLLAVLGLSVAFVACREEAQKSAQVRNEFLKQFDN